MGYIYIITNDINDKVYIGKTLLNITKRFEQHCKDAFRPQIEARPLYSAMRKYGIDKFHISLIEECSDDIISERECYWIEQYASYGKGYNATRGGDGKMIYNHSEILTALQECPYPKDVADKFGCCVDIVRQIAKNNNIEIQSKGNEMWIATRKSISCYDKTNQTYIATFDSVVSAAKWCYQMGKTKSINSGVRSHISDCANGKRKSAYGYIWKYE